MGQEADDRDQIGPELASGGEPLSAGADKRPGCLTAYALLLGLVAILHSAGVIFYIMVAVIFQDTAGLPVGGLALQLAVALVEVLIAWGVWRLRSWARTAVIVLQSLGIVAILLGVGASLEGPDAALTLGAVLIGVGISGYIIYWFASHGEYFA
jgi:hypothetical protein